MDHNSFTSMLAATHTQRRHNQTKHGAPKNQVTFFPASVAISRCLLADSEHKENQQKVVVKRALRTGGLRVYAPTVFVVFVRIFFLLHSQILSLHGPDDLRHYLLDCCTKGLSPCDLTNWNIQPASPYRHYDLTCLYFSPVVTLLLLLIHQISRSVCLPKMTLSLNLNLIFFLAIFFPFVFNLNNWIKAA